MQAMQTLRAAARMNRTQFLHCSLALLLAVACGCASAQSVLRLSTTTSTENSGLLNYLLPFFTQLHPMQVKVIAVGTGKALALAKNGDVDVTLVHARAAEDQFVAAGYGVNRRDVMFNDFVIVAPVADPAGIVGSKQLMPALRAIVEKKARFISRGDQSGTDQMEQAYWRKLGTKPLGSAYVSAGLGMGEVLAMAAELQAYTLTDRATFNAYRNKTGLVIAVQGDPAMFNAYGIIAVNPARYPDVNAVAARQLIDWITSSEGQKKIAAFRSDGEQVFFPAAKP